MERVDCGVAVRLGWGMIRSSWMLFFSMGLPVCVCVCVCTAGDVSVPVPSPEPRVELVTASRGFPSEARSLAVADLDGDGDGDLVNLPEGDGSITSDPQAYWMENLGGRDFAPLRLVHVAPRNGGAEVERPAVMNLTGDAKPEIFVSRLSAAGREPLALTPDLAGKGPAPVAGRSLGAAAAASHGVWSTVDLDADGQGELLLMTGEYTGPESYVSKLHVYDRQGDGSFAESAVVLEVEGAVFPTSYEAVDLDGDGDLELSLGLDYSRLVLERTGPRAFAGEQVWIEEIEGHRPWVDLDGDGLPEAVGTSGGWAENQGELNFDWQEGPPTLAAFASALFKEIERRAGQPALLHAVVPREDGGYEWVKVPFGTVEPVSRQMLPVDAAGSPAFLRMADVDGDGQLDLIYRYENAV